MHENEVGYGKFEQISAAELPLIPIDNDELQSKSVCFSAKSGQPDAFLPLTSLVCRTVGGAQTAQGCHDRRGREEALLVRCEVAGHG